MEILVSVVSKIAEYTVAPIGRQVGYLLFYKDNFKALEEAMKELKGEEDCIKHLVESETRNGKIIENVVQNWQDRAQEVTGEANQLFEDPRNAKVGCSNWSFPDLKSRHQLSRKATKMAKTIADVLAKGKFEKEKIGYLPPLDGVGSTFAARGCQKIESRVSMMMEIVSALTDHNVSKMGIYGLGGVGKTTLVKQVTAKAEEDKLFDAVVMANVTQSPDLKRIQGEIADLLGLQFNEETVFGRAFRLRKRIEQEKTILIILDDIWERLDLEEVGIPVEDDHKGCKVLMTSRTQDALRKMGTQKDFRLEILTEEETWSLFKLKAEVDNDPSLQYIATEVAKKCAGLPVLIVTVASALKNTDIHSWNDALNQLESIDNKEMHEIAYTALELSYSRLESDELKALFLLCGLLGGDPSIRDLLNYGMGLGIFKHINTVRDARNRLHKMISTLKSSCLLLGDDTIMNVEMHDIVSGVAISIASRDRHVFTVKNGSELKDWPSEDLLERCPYIILSWCHIRKIPERLDCPKLKFFYLNSGYNRSLQIPDSCFEGMGNLKVLDVTNMDMSSLPTSFHSLTNVKTLCLDHCTLVDIAAIGALKDLEILSMFKSSIAQFPSEIRLLTHLRMLDLTGSGIEVIPPNIISNLTRLEELYMGNTSIKWEPESSATQNKNTSLGELKQLPNLTALDIQIREAWVLPRDLMFEKLERYKIFIGDVWEWSGKYETSKTLKLKLHTSIHLEHGIKLLIRRVEDLYLDELNGISDVLFQLNGEGFPHLKHLHIQNNAEIKHIINSVEWTQSQDSFPKLETLVLQNLDNFEKISHGALMVNSFSNLKIIKVKSCDKLRYLLLSSIAYGLSQLMEVEVSECKSMKTIVLVESDTNVDRGIIEFCQLRSLTLQSLLMLDDFYFHELESSTTMRKCKQSVTYIPTPLFSKKVAFPNLETLKLSAINLKKIWDDDQVSAITSIQNLTYLIVEDCGALKYLFSSFRIATFPKLKWLEISKCHMMEEIIVTEEEANNNVFTEVGLLKLEKIIMKDMQNLKTIWHPQLTASSFGKLKTLEVKSCPKLVNIFPSYMQRKFSNLETLTVSDCDSMEEIFQLDANETCSEEDTTELKSMTLLRLQKLKQIWSREPQGILRFHNLQAIRVEDCYNLVYLFPFSVATNLLQLEELLLNGCGITYIVAKKEGPMEGTAIFVLDGLTSLTLQNLSKLKGFYSGIHTLACSSFKALNVFNCNKLKLFKTLSTRQRRSPDDTVYEQPLFTVEEVIPNLEELTLNNEDSNMILEGQFLGHLFSKLKVLRMSEFENEEATFPYWFLQNIPTLEWIVVECSSFKEIFQDEKLGGGEGQIKSSTQLKKLTLSYLPELQHICEEGSKIDPVLEVLETLFVLNCSGLTNLFYSSVTLSHLTYLEITNCNGLINITTCSAMRSLVKLKTMKIKECNSVEEIVFEKGDEAKEEIIFGALEILELVCLPKLNRFCSSKCLLRFQLLETVIVRQCPRMNAFSKGSTSALKLRKVQIEESDVGWCWEGDLNGTIRNMFTEKVAFKNIEHLRLVEYPELKELWYGKLPHKIFCSLKSLVVQKCDFLADTLFPSNLIRVLQHLEELEVRDCDLLEAVFEMEVIDAKEMQVKEITQLKKLSLSGLPRLKHVWRKDPKGTLSFQNLCIVNVANCRSLKSLFRPSIAGELMKLEELEVKSCGIEDIVAKEEGMDEIIEFVFPRLSSLKFWCLSNLKSLYPGKHTAEWPSLKKVDIYECNKLEIFAPGLPILLETKEEDGLDVQRQQPLFFVEKVIPNLDSLALNSKDAMMIWKGQYQENLFHNIKCLALQYFYEQSPTLISSFLQRFANLEKLELSASSFEMIFPWEGVNDQNTGMNIQIRQLRLEFLSQLKYLWSKDSQLDLFVGNLQSLEVINCLSLKYLAPSTICFENLTTLNVEDCQGLVYLITSSTARSLTQLTRMTIINCKALEDVINTNEEEAEEEISFKSLESLELTSLSSFRNFCSGKHTLIFPSLEVLMITGCPKMNVFSPGVLIAPMLKAVTVEEGKRHWKDGLNTTIKQLFQDKVAFHSFKHLELFEYPELKELWYGSYGQGGHQIFSNLKSLGVKKCDFLSDVLFPSNLLQILHNLEELEVTDCASLEALIDVKGTNGKEMQMKETSQLKRLKLSGLPNLKHIWNKDHHGIISFRNLLMVHAVDCENLKNLFPVSLSKDLVQLQELDIASSCGLVEIFAKEEGLEECSFDFPQMTKLRLWSLTKLKCFYPGRHTLDCPLLKNLTVYHCGALQTFSFDHSGFQQAYGMGEVDFSIPQALFPLEKVCPKLEQLALNGEDVMTIRNGHYQKTLFHKIEHLRLQCFHETQAVVPIDFLQRFPNLVKLVLRCSSFETLFPLEGVGHQNTGAPLQIRELILYKLEQLKYIWCEDSQSVGLVETLDSLPSSISFKNLTLLSVKDCKRLMYLITSSIARSLLQLTSIVINNCERIEDAVKNDEEIEEIITFQNLEYLELTSLSNLRSFCSGKQTFILPSLVDLVVTGCPKMKTFSSGVVIAPMLQSVAIENENKHWKGDLNTTIQQLFKGKETLNF